MGFLHRKEDAELPDSGGEPYFRQTRHIIGIGGTTFQTEPAGSEMQQSFA